MYIRIKAYVAGQRRLARQRGELDAWGPGWVQNPTVGVGPLCSREGAKAQVQVKEGITRLVNGLPD